MRPRSPPGTPRSSTGHRSSRSCGHRLGGIAAAPVRRSISGPPALPAQTSALVQVGVLFAELVPVDAVALAGVASCRVVASEDVHAKGNGLEMFRVDAVADAAEVVDGQAFWNLPLE